MRTFLGVALALAFAPGLLAQDAMKAADQALKAAIKDQNKEKLEAAVKVLLVANSAESMKALLAAVAKGPAEDDAWWMDAYFAILNAAASFVEPKALAELADFIVRNKDKAHGRDAMAIACQHGQKQMIALALRVLEGGTADLKIMASDHLVAIGDRACIEPLIKAMKANEKDTGEVKRRIGKALSVLTGQDYGDSVSNWEGWWASNKDKEVQPGAVEAGPSTGTVSDSLDRSRRSEFERLKKTGKLLVLQAGDKCKCGKNHDLDNIDKTTSKIGLTTETITKVDFETRDDLKLNEYVAILANCTHIREHCACPQCKPGAYSADRLYQCVCPINKHDMVRYTLGEKGVARIKRYVEGGGYLFAEDWCMEDFVAKAFGDYILPGSVRPDEIVTVLPKAGYSSHPYLKNIFFKPPGEELRTTVTEEDFEKIGHSWKIDKETRTIIVKDPKKVAVLLTSPDLEKKSKGEDAVAVTFGATPADPKDKGKKDAATGNEVISQDRKKMQGGRVLYVLSHFGKQVSAQDEYSLQNLLINFLIEANERRGSYAPPPPAGAKK
jgi:hypothetical protein